ncbi:MAG: Rab family GTPase [Promethearchaeota archaeon]
MPNQNENIIFGVIYTQFDDILGPAPISWYPEEISESIQLLISIKAITLLTGEEEYLPKDLVIVPFPSINSKGLIKYFEWEDQNRRGGIVKASLTILFKEFDDLIFYRYKDDLEPFFNKCIEKIIDIEKSNYSDDDKKDKLELDVKEFYNNVLQLLDDLKNQELAKKEEEAFPEADKQSIDYRFKVIVCGDPTVGKTSLILRFTYNAFTRTYMPTIGTSISEKNININGKLVQLIIWDIAGQSKFEKMRRHFYQGAEGVLLVFDITFKRSFENIKRWFEDIKRNLGQDKKLIGFIIGNKVDLKNQREVNREEAEKLSQDLGLEFFETSALTGENVNEMFYKIAQELVSSKN